MPSNILVVGSLNLDMVARVLCLPRPGETVAAKSFETSLGGKGANQAVACARLGAAVQMVGKVGTDPFGMQLRASLADAGVDIGMVEATEGASGLAWITVDDEAQNSITIVAGANAKLTPSTLRHHRDAILGASVVLAQLETPFETMVLLAEMAHEADIPLVLDPAPARVLPPELLKRVTWLTPNESEGQTLLGAGALRKPGETARELLATGCRNVVLKLGSAGVFLAGEDIEPTFVPAFPVDAVDTTAAGDAFNGAFAVALSEGRGPVDAARFACAAAALCVTRHGASAAMPSREEVEGLLARTMPTS